MPEGRFECRWVDELVAYVEHDFPSFKPDERRLEQAKARLITCDCDDHPPTLVCSEQTGECRLEDGRHRILAAKALGREKMLVRVCQASW